MITRKLHNLDLNYLNNQKKRLEYFNYDISNLYEIFKNTLSSHWNYIYDETSLVICAADSVLHQHYDMICNSTEVDKYVGLDDRTIQSILECEVVPSGQIANEFIEDNCGDYLDEFDCFDSLDFILKKFDHNPLRDELEEYILDNAVNYIDQHVSVFSLHSTLIDRYLLLKYGYTSGEIYPGNDTFMQCIFLIAQIIQGYISKSSTFSFNESCYYIRHSNKSEFIYEIVFMFDNSAETYLSGKDDVKSYMDNFIKLNEILKLNKDSVI